jgi:hypothetical protein
MGRERAATARLIGGHIELIEADVRNPWKLHRIDGGKDQDAIVGYCPLLLLQWT